MRLILIIILTVFCLDAHAQSSDSANHPNTDSATTAVLAHTSGSHIIWHDIKESWYDAGPYFTRPLHFDLREWAIIATGIGFTAMLELVDDDPVRTFLQHNQGSFGDKIASFGNNFYGNGYATGLTAITLYTVGLETDNNKLRVMARHVVQSFAYAAATTTVLKILLGRDRPFTNQGSFVYSGFDLNNFANSMPSGHVTVAAALSESLAADIDNPWASVGLYTLTAVTAFSRMYSDQHWLSDTFLAGVIGTATGYWVAHQDEHYDMQTNEPKHAGIIIMPTGNGIALVWPL